MDIEDYLSDLMEHGAGESLAGVDVDAVLREGERLGVRLRRRRRDRIALGAAAAVVAVSVGTTAAITRLEKPGAHETAAARPASSAVPSRAPATPPSASPSKALRRPVTYKDVASIFTKLLPRGFSVVLDSTTPPGMQSAIFTNLNVDDGQGTAVAILGVSAKPGVLGDASCSTGSAVDGGKRPAGALSAGCSYVALPGGARMVNVVTADDANGYYDLEVKLVRADGVTVSLTLGNGYVGFNVPTTVTRARPPLSIAQADALVQSVQWQTTVTAP